MGGKIIPRKSSLRSPPIGKRLQIRAEDDVTLGVYSSRRSGSALDCILQSWAVLHSWALPTQRLAKKPPATPLSRIIWVIRPEQMCNTVKSKTPLYGIEKYFKSSSNNLYRCLIYLTFLWSVFIIDVLSAEQQCGSEWTNIKNSKLSKIPWRPDSSTTSIFPVELKS